MVASPSALRRCHTCLQSCPREAFTRSQIRKRGKRARCKSCTSSSNRPTIQGKSAIPASSTDRDANSRLPRSDVYLRESRSNAAGEKSPVSEVSTIEGNAVKAPGSDEKRLEVKMTGLVNPAKKPESRVPSPTSVAEHPSVVSCGSPGESAAVSSEEMEYYGRKCTGLLFKLYREEKDNDEVARAAAIKFMAEHEGREKDLWEKLVQHEEKMETERQSLTPLLTKKQNDCNDNVSHTRSEEKPTIRGKIGMKRKRVEVATDLNCDRCDGAHESTKCPYYKKPRGNHPDEQRRRKGQGLASAGGNYFIPFHRARVRHQPGDGSCLYHSMCFGLRRRCRSAHSLRKELAHWVRSNQNHVISNTKLAEWIRWDSGKNVHSYAAQMMRGSWGGAIEMVACSKLYNCNIHVYQAHRGKRAYKRISCFNQSKARHTVNVLYQGGVHYDALIIK